MADYRSPLIGISCEIAPHPETKSSYDLVCDHRYAAAVTRAGGHPVLLPIAYRQPILRRYLEGIDGLVIVGGDDVDPRLYGEEPQQGTQLILPQRTTFETWLYRAGKMRKLPIFGICYGMQLINVIEGGSLHQDLPQRRLRPPNVDHRGIRNCCHHVLIVPSSRLAFVSRMRGALVHSEHHQAVKDLAPGFIVSAVARDGVIEAIENPHLPQILAVQWHPERSPDSQLTRRLFRTLVRLAALHRDGKHARAQEL
jgi:putative glutamine amidotransferase